MKETFAMQYPIDIEQARTTFEKLYGPASKYEREILVIHVKAINEAYEAGHRDGRKEATT